MPFQEQVPQKDSQIPPMGREPEPFPRIMYHDFRATIQTVLKVVKKFGLLILLGLIIYFIVSSSVFRTQSGYVTIYENQLTGQIKVFYEPGIHFKIPLISQVTRYNQVWTVNFGTPFAGKQILEKGPIKLRFADSYTAQIPAIFRYKLPLNKDILKRIHQDFNNFYNLIDSLLIPISKSVMVSTATQYTGEEFFLGGLNTFKSQLRSQLQYGIYETKRQQVDVEQRDLVGLFQDESKSQRTTSVKIWKTMPIKDADGDFKRMDNPLVDYGITVTQVELGVPIADRELAQLLDDKKRFDRVANQKADELALIMEEQKLKLADISKEERTQLALIKKEEKTQLATEAKHKTIQLAQEDRNQAFQLAQKATSLALVKEDEKIKLAKKAEELLLEKEDAKIELAKKEKLLAIELATTKARKEEELVIEQEDEKIKLAQQAKEQKILLAKKAEELALEQEDEKVKLAQQAKEQKILLAKKADELALEQEDEKVKLAQQAKQQKIMLAKKAEEFALVQEQQKIQMAQVQKDEQIQLAQEATNLALVQKSKEIKLAEKEKELAVVEQEKKIQVAKKSEELAIAKANQDIQKANLEAAQFEAKATREQGIAAADVLKAQYEARNPELYQAEIQKEIAAIIYPNLKGLHVTMPHNIVNLGDKNAPLQTNLDVLSSFATLRVMEGLESKALETDTAATSKTPTQ